MFLGDDLQVKGTCGLAGFSGSVGIKGALHFFILLCMNSQSSAAGTPLHCFLWCKFSSAMFLYGIKESKKVRYLKE